MAVSFANNNLNGHTGFLDGYISARTRVCVTVGMMTTGYDCEDLRSRWPTSRRSAPGARSSPIM